MSDEEFGVMHSSKETRDERQLAIRQWAEAAFGQAEAMSLPQRGLRLLEEAIEAYQAAGGDADTARKLVDFVFARPPGTVGQELGGVAVTTLALAAAAGLSADLEEQREVHRVLSKPIEEFRKRNANKNASGFLLAKCPPGFLCIHEPACPGTTILCIHEPACPGTTRSR